ncbi:MAG: hypothetical protein ACFFBD_04485 [Candidatus Hodarchaeota archaeon]
MMKACVTFPEVDWIRTSQIALQRISLDPFIENAIYESFDVLIFAFVPIALILWLYCLLQIFRYSSEKPREEKISQLVIPILFTLGVGEATIRFIISGSVQEIQADLDYVGWALMIIGWLYLIITLEAFEEVFRKVKIKSINPSFLYLGFTTFLCIFWIICQIFFDVANCLVILSFFYLISLGLMVLLVLPAEFSPTNLLRWLLILIMLLSFLIVYPGLLVDPPIIETQVYAALRNQIIILGIEGISLYFLVNHPSLAQANQISS